MYKIFLSAIATLCVLTSCQEDFDNRLKREATEYTKKHCPLRIEEGNTLDSLTYNLDTRTLTRWHSLSGNMDTQVAIDALCDHPELVRNQLLAELRNDVQMEACKEAKVFFTYVYQSASSRDTIFTTTFSPEDYRR